MSTILLSYRKFVGQHSQCILSPPNKSIRNGAIIEGLANAGGSEALAVRDALSQPAENYTNDATLEFQWAIKAYEHAEVFFNLVSSVDPLKLRLTKVDDQIYQLFRAEFKDLRVDVIDVDAMKSGEGKAKWREFCNVFEGQVQDWNMGSLLRINASEGITDENTFLVPRIQFLAVEICRNREGHNSCLRQKFKKGRQEES